MKNNNPIFVHMNIINIVIIAIALVNTALTEKMEIRLVFAGAAVLLVGGLYVAREIVRRHDFSYMAIMQLKKAGLSCKKVDDGFLVKQGDFIMKAKLWGNNRHGLKRVHFMLDFVPNVINDVLPEGWAVLVSECNANFDHTTVKFFGDHFSCMVETSVKSAKDFLSEYRFAFDRIKETIQGMEANTPIVVKKFPIKKKQIGFVLSKTQ